MKKSNIIIIVLSVAALGWMVAFQWMSAMGVRDFSAGKISRFADFGPNSHYRPDIITKTLPPFTDIEIRGQGKVEVTVEQGLAFSIRMDTTLTGPVKQHMEYDRMVLDLTGITEEAAGSYTITAPVLKSVTLDHLETTLIRGFSQPALTVKFRDVYPLTFRHCTLGSLSVTSADEMMTQYLDIGNTNLIDRLSITLYGKGVLNLGTTGKLQNNITIPDSMDIQATSHILKQLNLPGLK